MGNKTNRRRFLQLMAAGSTAVSFNALFARDIDRNPPNVLIIQPDQHRGTIMRCAGDEIVQTPHLDRLADDGIRFTHCASSSPLCSPFRGTMQTGLYPHTHGVDKNNVLLDPNFTTIAEIFAGHGYATGYIGKWHLDGGIPHPQPGGYVPPGSRRQGYQEWYGYEKSHEYFKVWKYNKKRKQVRVPGYEWEPTWQTDIFLDFARRHRDEGKPWMYYLAYGPPHPPEECLKKYLDLYNSDSFALPPDVATRFSPDVTNKLRRHYQMYYALVTAIDVEIGRIVEGLENLGVDENTIILYTSDHGDKLGSHCQPNKLRGKAAPFATAFRIPMIVRWPKEIASHQVNHQLVSSVDLAPTILELAGLPVPEVMQGAGMAKSCFGKRVETSEAIYLGLGGAKGKNGWRAVWDGRFVYCPFHFNILYDHKDDPYEMKNLIDSAAFASERKRLGDLMVTLAEKTRDPMLAEVKKACEG